MDTSRIFKQLMNTLDDNCEVFITRLPKKIAGRLFHTRIIVIDDRKDDALSVLVHELFHALNPKKSEAGILKMESAFMRSASWGQKKKLLRRLIGDARKV